MSKTSKEVEIPEQPAVVDSKDLYLPKRFDGVDFTFTRPGAYESGVGRDRTVKNAQPGIRIQTSRGNVIVTLQCLLDFHASMEAGEDPELIEWLTDIHEYETSQNVIRGEFPGVKKEVSTKTEKTSSSSKSYETAKV